MSQATVNLQSRSGRLAWVVLGLFVATGFSQGYKQIFSAAGTIQKAKKAGRYTVERQEVANRASIFSGDDKVLAQSVDQFDLSMTLMNVPHVPGFYVAFGEAAGVSPTEIAQAVASGRKALSWPKKIGPEQATRIRKVKKDWVAHGISLARTSKRIYPLGEATGSLLGTYSTKAEGGLEMTFDSVLAGKDGKRVGLIDRTGAFLPMRMEAESQEKQDGEPVQLTLNVSLQVSATQLLRTAVTENRATSGVAIVMEPTSGDILAMTSWPAADPGAGRPILGFDPNYSEVYEPGSTFKILTLAAALDAGVVGVHDTTQCQGEIHWGKGYRVRCDLHHGNRAHGLVDSELAIAKSCNVAASTWARKVGYKPMLDYIDRLGLLHKTKIGVQNEVAGLFNFKEVAQSLQIANVGFGQSISCTPIGLASAFTSLANGGVRMQPRLVKRIGLKDQPVQKAARVFSPDVAHQVMKLMESVIETDAGTGKKLRIPGVRLAGKTGTAEKIGGGASGHVSSFIGYVPAENPRAVILVMIDNPSAGKIYGAEVAGPVFRAIAEEVLRTDAGSSGRSEAAK